MSGIDSDEPRRLRPNLRPLGLALVANVLFGVVLVGLPYRRGGERAREATRDFARFSACLLDGRTARAPGLILPRNQRARFATLALSGGDWPARCRDELSAVAVEEATLLFPAVKSAENEVRAAVAQLARELEHVVEGGRVIERPLAALSQLQAALSELVRAADIDVDPARPAITIAPSARDLRTPSIVPIRIAFGGRWDVGSSGEGLVVSAADRRNVGHVRVAHGRVEQRVARRTTLVSGMLGGREPPWLIWSTPASRCADECASRATGLAGFVEDRQTLTNPWARLQAHPIGEPEDAVHLGSAVWIAALAANGEMEVRRFPVPQRPSGEPAQLAVEATRAVPARDPRVRWIAGEPPALAWASEQSAGISPDGVDPVVFESPGRTVEIATAGTAQDGWFAFGSERAVLVRRADGSGQTLRIEMPLAPPERGALRLVCGSTCARVEVWMLSDRRLSRASCEPASCTAPAHVSHETIARFDVARFRGATLLAWTDDARRGAIRIARVSENARPASRFAGVCWEPSGGLCGEPRLAVDARRAMLVARHGSDLRVLASEDGSYWHGLPGLEQP